MERHEQQALLWELAGDLRNDQDIEALLRDAESPALASDAHPIRSNRWKALGLVAAASAVVLILVTLGVVFEFGNGRQQVYATHLGEERTILLSDHSQVALNTATRIRVNYQRTRRLIALEQGEATFTVAHDASRPFEVSAAGGTARALGTTFNVLANGSRITVTVLEGRVAVAIGEQPKNAIGGAAAVVIASGEQVTYAGSSLTRPEPADIARIQGWHAGKIVLNDMALADAIAEFNRYSRVPLRLNDPSLATRRITGVFRSGETDAFLDALKEAFDLHVERTDTSITLR